MKMTTAQTVLLGAIAGLTIFLGLPVGRMRSSSPTLRIFLNGVSAGILVYLLLDIFEHAIEPVEDAVKDAVWSQVALLGTLLVLGLAVGLLGLYYVGRSIRSARPRQSPGPGAMAVAEAREVRTNALRVGMSIAVGIGLHNFSEGLAIGQAAHASEISLALLLVIGFALHNATEGFGIVGPVVAAGERATWGWLIAAGLIAGGPTFLGTVVGTTFTSEALFVAFLALAAGAILYVVGELFSTGRRMSWEVTLWGVFAGFALGVATELVLVAAGA
jgi:ZIP family zinc transporter